MDEIVFGMYAVQAMLNNDPQRFKEVWILQGRADHRLRTLVKLLEMHQVTIYTKTRSRMDQQSEGGVHQGIIAVVQKKRPYQENDLLALLAKINNPFLLILDGIMDPHNLGACIRNADAAGVHAVIIPKDRSAQLTPIVRKVASGSAENVPLVHVTNLARVMRCLQRENIWIIGTTEKTHQTLYQSNLTGPLSLVMGSEEKGMRRLTQENCNELVHIPMLGGVSSLNVSVATGICLYEAVRQRNLCTKKQLDQLS
ncbi:23S rRNA (guanosine-2'-O-)-methyltransferase RlmB [Candidatus Erwinia haradaeae]|uniref:23S rRNA (guanosine-2'-O-)-methyltransferase RlmB n=1 Tax=Candidatus Erwinia haradaeae TaxID=1922217 RepID=A0A451DIX6_9GAMM|nr:23S rRNA (guanosine(2251)-2'-O)-methyltransferase RlmB [Candidatus Erwinia haradaeae]VFP86658.1 23S rRNA (guanosine-2'-O-)-methyltransferase RlmB [Candidatus Erwinia haradaeae]